MRSFALVIALALAACPSDPPLSITVDHASLEADGLNKAHVTIHVRDAVTGAVVQFTADGGALSSSSVPIVDQAASVDLFAPLEKELGRHASRDIAVIATVALSKDAPLSATTTVRAVPPTSGAPILFLDADPPAAVAGSGGTVSVSVLARRVAAGVKLAVVADGADVVDASPAVDGDGAASARIAVPADPGDATVTITEPASGALAKIVVRFVAPGQPLFDLTGAFVQIGPARVRLRSGGLAPNPQCAVAPSLVLAQFTQTDLHVDASYTTCDVTFPPVTSIVGTVTNTAGDSFYAAIPAVNQSFDLDTGALGAAYAPPPSIVVVGATLADPAHDKLPSDETDPRVVDADNDGHPGVTVQDSLGGDQFIVFRNVGTSKGTVRSSNLVLGDQAGDLEAVTETSVFGIGNAFLPDTEALGSVLEVVRIDGKYGAVNADANGDGTISCAELKDVAASVDDLEVPDTPFDCGDEK